jgi:hypothetical protein
MESFKILALSGGGSKGYLHIGALEILEEKVGNLHEYFKEGIYGCSVGSIIGTAIAFGIPLKKIKELFKSLSFNELFKIDMKVEEIFIKIEPFQESDRVVMFNVSKDEYEYVDESLIVEHSCSRCEIIKNISEFSCEDSTYCRECSKIVNTTYRDSMRGKLMSLYTGIRNERRFDEPYLTLEEFLLQSCKRVVLLHKKFENREFHRVL